MNESSPNGSNGSNGSPTNSSPSKPSKKSTSANTEEPDNNNGGNLRHSTTGPPPSDSTTTSANRQDIQESIPKQHRPSQPCPCEGERCNLTADSPAHGKRRPGYLTGYCRCKECRAAHAEYIRVSRHSKRTHRRKSNKDNGDWCSVVACERPQIARKMCRRCYERFLKQQKTTEITFEEFIKIRPGGKGHKTTLYPEMGGKGVETANEIEKQRQERRRRFYLR